MGREPIRLWDPVVSVASFSGGRRMVGGAGPTTDGFLLSSASKQ